MVEAKQLADAVWVGDLVTVEYLIAAGADVDSPANDGREPPLHLAIEQQRVEIARRLIAAGANVNQDLGDGWTPLVHAIDVESDSAWQSHHKTGHEPTVLTELLLATGAKPTKQAFDVAESYRNNKAMELLRRYAEGGLSG